jgi:hypothetical protein
MRVIHFTLGATDPLATFRALRTNFVPLAEGEGDVQVSCLHFAEDSAILEPPTTHACVLLIVHGRVDFNLIQPTMHLQLWAGMGIVLEATERYTLASRTSAILIIVEALHLKPHSRGISTPARIEGQRWPGEEERAAC